MRTRFAVRGALTALTLLATAILVSPANALAPAMVRRAIVVATPTPIPTPQPLHTFAPLTGAHPGTIRRALPPLPPMPKTSGNVRRILSATGACIAFAYNAGCTLGAANENFVTGQNITWQAEKLPATTAYQDYVVVPGSGTPIPVGAVYNGPTGAAETQTSVVPGVYVFASLNNLANTWDAIAYVLVGAPVSIETYADGALTTKNQTFTTSAAGTTLVYIATQGLNPLHQYAVGIEDQLTGKCVFTAPSSAQATVPVTTATLCNLASGAVTGTNPTGTGLLLANWGVTLATPPALPQPDTYMATVYDQTAGQRVASRLFSVVDGRATAPASVMLQFTGTLGTTPNNASASRVAWNGNAAAEDDPNQNNVRLLFGATVPVASDTYSLVVSDPTGNVAATMTSASGQTTISPTNNQWTLPSPAVPFEQAYPGSTWTATVYDATTKKFLASQAFQILGYSASVLFQNPPAAQLPVPTNGGGAVSNGITYTNTADQIFGANNGDPIKQFTTTSGTTGFLTMSLTPPGSSTPCVPSGNVCTATYTDSVGNAWTTTLSCTGTCGGNFGGTYTLTSVPVNPAKPLMPNASLTVTGLTFMTTVNGKGQANCNSGCQLTNAIVPSDMILSSLSGGNTVANPLTFTNAAPTLSATGSVALVGYYDSGNGWHAAQSAGYTPRFNQALFAANQPFTASASKVVFSYTVNNAAPTAGTISVFDLLLPPGFNQASVTVDAHSPNGATITNSGYCFGLQRPTICVTPTTQIPTGQSQTFDFAVSPATSSFSYTDVVATAIAGGFDGYAGMPTAIAPASSSVQTFIGSPTQIDSTALGAYSLNGNLMIGQLAPGSVGTNTTNTLNYNLVNTPTGADPFPDEVDFAVVQIPNQTYTSFPTSCSGLTVNTAGWSCLYASAASGQPTTYMFGQCTQQLTPTPTLPAIPILGSDLMTVCPFARPNEPYSLAPGGNLSISIPVTTGTTQTPAGSPIAITTWAHGATTNGWTTPIVSTLAVNPSASAGVGFSQISSPTGGMAPVTSGTEPQIVGNYNATTGNTYLYTVHNTGNTPITSVTIGIPGPDTTGTNGADAGGNFWKLTSAPTLTVEGVGNADGCTETYTNPTNGLDTSGNITITCPAAALISGRTLDVQFNALAPDKINSTYNWPATVNGTASAASANWFADTEILIALSANVAVSVNPTAACAGVTVTPATQMVDFGNVAANSNRACVDSMVITVTTDAASPTTWGLYVSASGNPARTAATGSPNELNVETDATNSTGAATIPCPTSVTPPCFAYSNTTAYTPIQLTASGAGTQVAGTTGSGTGANNSPVKVYLNTQVSIGTETVPATGYAETITVTWIAN